MFIIINKIIIKTYLYFKHWYIMNSIFYYINNNIRGECPICLDIINNDELIMNTHPDFCVHFEERLFHAQCLNRYIFECNIFDDEIRNREKLEYTILCPLCRKQFFMIFDALD